MWLCGSFCLILSTVARTVYTTLRKYLFVCLLIFRIVEPQQIQPQHLRACGIFSIVLYIFRVSFFYMLKVKNMPILWRFRTLWASAPQGRDSMRASPLDYNFFGKIRAPFRRIFWRCRTGCAPLRLFCIKQSTTAPQYKKCPRFVRTSPPCNM